MDVDLRYEASRQHVRDLLAQPTTFGSREVSIEVQLVDWGVPRQALECKRIHHRYSEDGPAQLPRIHLSQNASNHFVGQRLVTMHHRGQPKRWTGGCAAESMQRDEQLA